MTRIIAAALCCLLLTACGSLIDRLSDYQRDRQDDTTQGALEYMKAKKQREATK